MTLWLRGIRKGEKKPTVFLMEDLGAIAGRGWVTRVTIHGVVHENVTTFEQAAKAVNRPQLRETLDTAWLDSIGFRLLDMDYSEDGKEFHRFDDSGGAT